MLCLLTTEASSFSHCNLQTFTPTSPTPGQSLHTGVGFRIQFVSGDAGIVVTTQNFSVDNHLINFFGETGI
jgi:hypothetical protein